MKVKAKWGKPKLTVLIKSLPEEGVLANCKVASEGVVGPVNVIFTGCNTNMPVCGGCSTFVDS
jgi:hypothetical protein